MIHEVLKGLIYIHSSSYLHLFQFYFHSTLETSKQPISSSIPTDPSVSPTSASFHPPTPPNVTPLTDSSERPAGWLPKWSATVSSLHPYPPSSLSGLFCVGGLVVAWNHRAGALQRLPAARSVRHARDFRSDFAGRGAVVRLVLRRVQVHSLLGVPVVHREGAGEAAGGASDRRRS